jgi:ABC-type transport system substrate-binding protein
MVRDALSMQWHSRAATIRPTTMLLQALLLGLASWIGVGSQGARAADFVDPTKVLRVSMDGEEAGFDPQAIGDSYSFTVTNAIFEPPYQYDYYGGPRIVPMTAEDLPEISADRRTWIIRLKRGIRFSDDAAFKGAPHELTAYDYVYTWKRLLDPRVRSPNSEILADRLSGARAAIEKAQRTGRFDYDAKLEGLRARDRYTIELTLIGPPAMR